jgi:hypothetical protein
VTGTTLWMIKEDGEHIGDDALYESHAEAAVQAQEHYLRRVSRDPVGDQPRLAWCWTRGAVYQLSLNSRRGEVFHHSFTTVTVEPIGDHDA